eukprot:92529_1
MSMDNNITKKINNNNIFEYFLTVGLNSNITENEFKRKNLNLVVVLDISGSMNSSFAGTHGKSKIDTAIECILSILTQLTWTDRFGLVSFRSIAQ